MFHLFKAMETDKSIKGKVSKFDITSEVPKHNLNDFGHVSVMLDRKILIQKNEQARENLAMLRQKLSHLEFIIHNLKSDKTAITKNKNPILYLPATGLDMLIVKAIVEYDRYLVKEMATEGLAQKTKSLDNSVRRLSIMNERLIGRKSVIRPDERPTTEIKAEFEAANSNIEACTREIENIKGKLHQLQENFEDIQCLGIWARVPAVYRMIDKATATDESDTSERIAPEGRSKFSYKGFLRWLFFN